MQVVNVKKIVEHLDDPAPFTVLVMEAEELDARMGLFKALSEKTIVVDCEPSEDMNVRLGLAVTMAGEIGARIKVELITMPRRRLRKIRMLDSRGLGRN